MGGCRISLRLRFVDRISEHIDGAIVVGMGEAAVSKDKSLATLALGSCVAIVLYDPVTRVGGIVHAMLPCSKGKRLPKYVDTGVEILLSKLAQMEAKRNFLVSGIIGGGTIFNFGGELAIGKKNIEASRSVLRELNIPIVLEEVDGKRGRSMMLDIATGTVTVMVSKPPVFRECELIERT
ncbi:MAG: chemotaxis protein CheD [Candidatus Verstraetearchaeota archaeon]|nr:chemotaxis protein CheD [Candidatus Verstraetearchaeota archaeon]